MTTTTTGKKARAHQLTAEHSGFDLLRYRIQNIGNKYVSYVDDVPEEKLISLLTVSDEEFWSEFKYLALTRRLINAETPEKKEQEDFIEARLVFLKTLEEYGGVHKSATVASLTGTSVVTVHKHGNQGKLIQLDWGAERLYPVFQFSVDEERSDKGMLKGVKEILEHITHNVSDVRKCNFFTRRIEMPLSENKESAIDILRRGPTKSEMEHLLILADNFGTNHTM